MKMSSFFKRNLVNKLRIYVRKKRIKMYKKYWGNTSLISIVQKSRHYFNSYFNIKIPDFILLAFKNLALPQYLDN